MDARSIFDLPPIEHGGRNARRGFAFQDHAAARLCLEAIRDGAPAEIRVEHHDDITLTWRDEHGELSVEFIQVKAHRRSARWSVASLTAPDPDGGPSLLEKSLRQARGAEDSRFRIITTTETDDRLSLLKLPREHPERSSAAFAELIDQLDRRLPGVSSENGMDVRGWAGRCLWERPADSVEALQALNVRMLEDVLTARGVNLPYASRDEMYDSLLNLIAMASSSEAAAAMPMTAASLREWLDTKIAQMTTVLWTRADLAATIDSCRAATTVEIETRVGRKYIPELYVEREIDHTLADFVAGEDRSFILVEKAGSGKTNLLCNVALRHASECPVLFFSGRLALSAGGLVAEVLDRLGPYHEAVFRELSAAGKPLVVVIDGINENNDPHGMRDALVRLIQFSADKPVKLIVSCRDLFWPAFDGEHWGKGTVRAGARSKARSHTLHDFTADEFAKAHERYFEYFRVRAELRGEARLKCRHPLLLRFFCEAYGTEEGEKASTGPTFDDIRLKTLFDVYWSRKLDRIREFSTDPMVKGAITDVLFAIADFLLAHHRKDISRLELHAAGAPIGSALAGVLSRICDEDIVVAQDGDLGVTSFVYDEFMEYTMSRMLFERRRWKEAPPGELTQGIVELLDSKREYSHVQNVAQYLLLWIEDEHPDVHDAVVLSLVRSGPAGRRVVASAAPKFRRVSPQHIRALEIAASTGDDIERGDVAFAVARLYRDGTNTAVATLFHSLAKRASAYAAMSLLGGLEAATALSRDVVRFAEHWSGHRDARVRLAVADFLVSDAARSQPDLRALLTTLARDAESAVQDAALLSARLAVSDPADFVSLLSVATSPGGIAAGVSWLLTESGFADRVDRDALARELASRHDSTLDKAALRIARTLEEPSRRAEIAEEVCQHMDYRSFHEAAKLAFAYGDRDRYLQRYQSLSQELKAATVFTRGILRRSQGSLRRRRATIERIFETADWAFLADVDADAVFAICRDLLGPKGMSESRLPAFLQALQPFVERPSFSSDPRAASLIVETVRQAVARKAEDLMTWAETHVHVTDAWSEIQLAELLEALIAIRHRPVGYVGFLRFLRAVRSEAVFVKMGRCLARTGLAGVCAALMRTLTAAPRNDSAIEAILSAGDSWSMSACNAVARAVHVTNDSTPVLLQLGRQWTRDALFEPLLELSARVQDELPGWMSEWFRHLEAAGLSERVPDSEVCIRAYGQDFSADDVKAAVMRLLHAQWVILCARSSIARGAPASGHVSGLALREVEGFPWQSVSNNF